jgi:hypothetical protein
MQSYSSNWISIRHLNFDIWENLCSEDGIWNMEGRKEEGGDNANNQREISQVIQTPTVTNSLFRDKYPLQPGFEARTHSYSAYSVLVF